MRYYLVGILNFDLTVSQVWVEATCPSEAEDKTIEFAPGSVAVKAWKSGIKFLPTWVRELGRDVYSS